MKKIIKNRSLGLMNTSDYTCKYDWPTDCFVQCGGKGIVMGNQHKKGYVTAFFEAFPFNNFIRGEGETVDLAEDAAWKKYQVMATCSEHHFIEDKKRKRDAVCEHCGYSIKNYYPPHHQCSCCDKEHVSLEIGNEYFCLEHFIEKAKHINYEITDERLIEFKKEVVKEIELSQDKDKNLIDMMLGKNDLNVKSYEDIADDDYRVEMKISNLKNIELMKNILIAAQMVNISNKFASEYEFIDWIQNQKDSLSMTAIQKTTEFFNVVIDNMKDNKYLNSEFNSREYFDKTEDKFNEIESKVKLSLFIFNMAKEFDISNTNIYIYEPLIGLSKTQVADMIQTEIMLSVFNYIGK